MPRVTLVKATSNDPTVIKDQLSDLHAGFYEVTKTMVRILRTLQKEPCSTIKKEMLDGLVPESISTLEINEEVSEILDQISFSLTR